MVGEVSERKRSRVRRRRRIVAAVALGVVVWVVAGIVAPPVGFAIGATAVVVGLAWLGREAYLDAREQGRSRLVAAALVIPRLIHAAFWIP